VIEHKKISPSGNLLGRLYMKNIITHRCGWFDAYIRRQYIIFCSEKEKGCPVLSGQPFNY
jgi:hypothetical protein